MFIRPSSLLNGLAEIDEEDRIIRPLSTKRNLEKGADDSSCVLRRASATTTLTLPATNLGNVCRVGDKRKVFDEHFGYVCLQSNRGQPRPKPTMINPQDVDLAMFVADTALKPVGIMVLRLSDRLTLTSNGQCSSLSMIAVSSGISFSRIWIWSN